MSDLAVLRTAKTACDEGLINQEDYDFIKKAFLRAQQIKAGMDAGFLREEDFLQARDSFLHSLDFSLVASASAAQSPQSFPLPAVIAPSGQGSPITNNGQPLPAAPPLQTYNSRGLSKLPDTTISPTANGASVVAASGTSLLSPQSSGGPVAPPAPAPLVRPAGSNALPSGTVPVPTEIPRMGRVSSVSSGLVGKKSMSGIGVHENCVNIFNVMKAKSSYKWVSFRVNDEGNEVVIDQCGAQDSTYEQFVATLPENQCRYAVYDYAYANADTQQTVNKLVFVYWAPDTATTKARMMYASTKDFFKGFLDGVGADLQATSAAELSEAEIRDRVHQALTRK